MSKEGQCEVGLILLAAGASERMGHPKQLLRLKGESLVRKTAKIAISALFEPVVVVVGAASEMVIAEISDLSLTVVYNPQWQEGMGTSIRTGIVSLLHIDPFITGVLLLLCDQPNIDVDYLKNMKENFRDPYETIVATSYGHGMGVPALFPSKYFSLLKKLNGDAGARKILLKEKEIVLIEASDETLRDIDTPEEYSKFISS